MRKATEYQRDSPALGTSAEVMALVSGALEGVVRQNQDLRQSQPTSFDAVSAPSISVSRYLTRIRQYTKFHDECFAVALIYLDRLFANHKAPFLPTAHNVHRLIITSVLVASKFYDDVFHSNSFMAQVGGISVAEMNKLEIELCLRLNWELHVMGSEFDHMVSCLHDRDASLWRRWQHHHAMMTSSDEDITPVEERTPSLQAQGPTSVFAKAKMPLWGGGFRSVSSADPSARRGSSPQGSSTSPATSVSVH
mmetsp:Transcript_27879/g.81953  ORF Transcript_27879/g.81953 Transcript_27879/m.81953 type:complete len:251 (+) Transcript_27879:107-859(+)